LHVPHRGSEGQTAIQSFGPLYATQRPIFYIEVKTIVTHLNIFYSKIYFLLSRSIYEKEGVTALWKGTMTTLVGVIPSKAIYFFVYHEGKEYLKQYNFGKESSLIHVTSAFFSASATATITNPLWVIKTKIQLNDSVVGSHTMTWPSVSRNIYKERGLKGSPL
jgi:hypothetical protein